MMHTSDQFICFKIRPDGQRRAIPLSEVEELYTDSTTNIVHIKLWNKPDVEAFRDYLHILSGDSIAEYVTVTQG